MGTELQAILDRVEQVPLLPQTATQLMEVMADPDHGIQDVRRLVECDQALAAQVLRTVNAAAFGLASEVSSLARALSLLGNKMVLDLAMRSAQGKLYDRPLRGYEAGEGELWRHSLCTALSARSMAPKTGGRVSPDLAYTAGMLHDLGKYIISDFLIGNTATTLAALDSQDNQDRRDYLRAEQTVLGTDHCAVGEALAAHWKLPLPLRLAARHHHHPADAPSTWRALVYTVHLGDMLAMMAGHGTGTDALAYTLDASYSDFVALTREELELAILNADREFRRTEAALFSPAGDVSC